jgi:hypothetical protein
VGSGFNLSSFIFHFAWQIALNAAVSFQPLASAGNVNGASSMKLRNAGRMFRLRESNPRLGSGRNPVRWL